MRKLSFEENLRHRLHDLPRFRYREEKSSAEGLMYLALGAVVGLAAGALLAQRYGGFGAITSRLRDRFGGEGEGGDSIRGFGTHGAHDHDDEDYDDEDDDDFDDLSPMEELEERVLDAYHNDPILNERAIDIGAIDEGIIELTGWVRSMEESTHAVTIARGTPGVETVVNRLAIRDTEDIFDARAERYAAADDDADTAERHTSSTAKMSGDRTGGAPVTPTGVPKADHVAIPGDAPQTKRTDDTNAIRGD